MKLLVANLGIALASVVAAILMSEWLVRMFNPQLTYRYPQDLFVADGAVGYRLQPDFTGELDTPEYRTEMHINRQGLRAEVDYGPKPPGVFRILLLGDSFTMGIGVAQEQTAAKLLESRLNAGRGGPRVEVLNAGVAGYGTVQEVAYLSAYGFALEPDLIVLGLFVGNDVLDNGAAPLRVQDGYLINANGYAAGTLPIPVRRFLSLHSQLYHLLWPHYRRVFGDAEADQRARTAEFALMYDRADADEVVSDTAAWSKTYNAIGQLADLCRSRGVPLAIVLIPDRVQVSKQLWGKAVESLGLGRQYSPSAPNERLHAFCEAAGVPVFDLLPVLGLDGDGGSLYFELDHHWTSAGNQRAAEVLEPFLRRLMIGMMPPDTEQAEVRVH